MRLQLDHILTFADVPHINSSVERYRALGFDVTDEARPYKPGLLNRFVQLGCEYLELVWVADEDEFARGGGEDFARMFADLGALRRAGPPFSIGFVTDDVAALHRQLIRRGFDVPQVWSFAPPGMPPLLSFQVIPTSILPGANCFAITYHSTVSGQVRTVRPSVNTVYAVEGITFVSAEPEDAARRWQALLAPDRTIAEGRNGYALHVLPHTIWWTTQDALRDRYAIDVNAAPPGGQIAAIHLLAADLSVAATLSGSADHCQHTRRDEMLVVAPTGQDGVVFVIREAPLEQWRSERTGATGETIELESSG